MGVPSLCNCSEVHIENSIVSIYLWSHLVVNKARSLTSWLNGHWNLLKLSPVLKHCVVWCAQLIYYLFCDDGFHSGSHRNDWVCFGMFWRCVLSERVNGMLWQIVVPVNAFIKASNWLGYLITKETFILLQIFYIPLNDVVVLLCVLVHVSICLSNMQWLSGHLKRVCCHLLAVL